MSHADQPVYAGGTEVDAAFAAMILLHGRGATAEDILSLSTSLAYPGLTFLAPQAEDYTWYPNRFIAPLAQNEPYLSSALARIDEIVKQIETRGIPTERIFLGGFSQGACLACEYVIRHPRRYGGLLIFSGGYIGPLDEPREPEGDLNGTPVFLGCSDPDPHIPLQRVRETSALLRAMHAQVTEQIYPDLGHMMNKHEIDMAKSLVKESLQQDQKLNSSE
jgi:predicted esterase